METIIIQPQSKEKLTALKAFIKALKIEFKTIDTKYSESFVEKILQGREDIKKGNGIKIAIEDLWK